MRILVISNLFPDRKQPTFGTFMRSHVDALRYAGADVELVAIRGVGVHTRIGRKYLRLFAEAVRAVLWSVLRRRPPQVVEAHIAYPTGVIAWPLARLVRAKLVLYVHGADVHEVGRRTRAHHRLARFVFARADLIAVNSRYSEQSLLAGYGAAPGKVVVWSPGIDIAAFRPIPDAVRDSRQVMFVGRLDPQKGVDVLLEAVSQLDGPVSLRIIGDGPDRASLEAEAGRLGLDVRFDGGVEHYEVARAMASTAAVVVPSAFGEALGLVALEAMAAGAVVIASATGGLAETVDDGVNGFLVAPGNPAALTTRIAYVLELLRADGEELTRIREAARQRAEAHDIDAVAIARLERYRALVGRPSIGSSGMRE